MPARSTATVPHAPDDYETCVGLMYRESVLQGRLLSVLQRLDSDDCDDFDRHLAGDQLVGLAITLRDLLKRHPRHES